MMDVQSQLMASVVSGRTALPSPGEMRRDIARERRFMVRRFPTADRYGLELDPGRYRKQVATEQVRRAAGDGRQDVHR